MSKYPQHEKAQAVKDKSQAIGDFIDWLRDAKGFALGKWSPEEDGVSCFHPYHPDLNKLLAEFFEIDYDEFQAEKDRMLDELREATRSRE